MAHIRRYTDGAYQRVNSTKLRPGDVCAFFSDRVNIDMSNDIMNEMRSTYGIVRSPFIVIATGLEDTDEFRSEKHSAWVLSKLLDAVGNLCTIVHDCQNDVFW